MPGLPPDTSQPATSTTVHLRSPRIPSEHRIEPLTAVPSRNQPPQYLYKKYRFGGIAFLRRMHYLCTKTEGRRLPPTNDDNRHCRPSGRAGRRNVSRG